jgi:hypothetical protein
MRTLIEEWKGRDPRPSPGGLGTKGLPSIGFCLLWPSSPTPQLCRPPPPAAPRTNLDPEGNDLLCPPPSLVSGPVASGTPVPLPRRQSPSQRMEYVPSSGM